MTISITPTNGQDHWGPGVFFTFSSDQQLPGAAPFTITIQLWRHGTETLIWNYIIPNQNNIQGGLKIGYGTDLAPLKFLSDATPVNNDSVIMEITAKDNRDVQVDYGERTFPWSETTQLHNELQDAVPAGGTGGFTSTDRATITGTKSDTESILEQWANYTSVTLPTLDQVLANIDAKLIGTILTMTGPVGFPIGQLLNGFDPNLLQPADLSGGTQCERIDVDVSFNALYGVGLRIDTYPEGWPFRTPDRAWSFHDLAVLSFWRSGSLVERHGIHALTHSVSPIPDSALFSLGPIFGYLQPGDYHITVDWAAGVCGTLTGMVLP